jgi:hypothetical protein
MPENVSSSDRTRELLLLHHLLHQTYRILRYLDYLPPLVRPLDQRWHEIFSMLRPANPAKGPLSHFLPLPLLLMAQPYQRHLSNSSMSLLIARSLPKHLDTALSLLRPQQPLDVLH